MLTKEMMNVWPHKISTIKICKASYLGHHMRHKDYELVQEMLQGKQKLSVE